MTVPTAVWFSAASNVTGEVNSGDALASVEPLPESDQPLSPSSLVARTCTWYSVSSASPGIGSLGPLTSCGPTVKAPLVPMMRYCRS